MPNLVFLGYLGFLKTKILHLFHLESNQIEKKKLKEQTFFKTSFTTYERRLKQ